MGGAAGAGAGGAAGEAGAEDCRRFVVTPAMAAQLWDLHLISKVSACEPHPKPCAPDGAGPHSSAAMPQLVSQPPIT